MTAASQGEIRRPPLVLPPAARSTFRARCADFWLGSLFRLAAVYPASLRIVRPLGVWAATRFSRVIRTNSAINSRRIFGRELNANERRRFAWQLVGNFFDFIGDLARSVRSSPDQLQQRIDRIVGHDRYCVVRAQKRGAIILTAHMGSFEIGFSALKRFESQPIHVVFKRDRSGVFDRIRAEARQRLGVMEAPIDGGLSAWMELRGHLKNDHVVAIQGDRVMPGQKGTSVSFLGGHLLLPTGPFKLAAAADAPIIPVFSVRMPNGKIAVFVEEPITTSPEQGLEAFAGALAKFVSTYPDQWLVLEPAFWEDSDSCP